MTTSMLAFGKANVSGSLKVAQKTAKQYTTSHASVPAPTNGNGGHTKPVDLSTQRELFMNVLNANATKRDAKQYLARFKPPKKPATPPQSVLSPLQQERNARHQKDQDRLDSIGVNLGGLYAPARAIAESPQFYQQGVDEKADLQSARKLHVALVCLKNPENLDDATLEGVALTLSQLVKLDMHIVLVLDCASHFPTSSVRGIQAISAEQAGRVERVIAKYSSGGARLVSGAIEAKHSNSIEASHTSEGPANLTVGLPNLILGPLRQSIVPIVPSIAHTPSGKLLRTSAAGIMHALTGLLYRNSSNADNVNNLSAIQTSLDRIILLDEAGGIPSKARGDGAHVFINLEQEYNDIQTELKQYAEVSDGKDSTYASADVYERHRSNLRMLQDCLASLPSSTSALIITPQEAASSSQTQALKESDLGTGTRRQKNTLIHNLLTNKPIVSPSLPAARLASNPSVEGNLPIAQAPRSTLVKRGMPVSVIPAAPRGTGWLLPESGSTTLSLENDSQVDLPRLVHLIEDSFRRKLDVRDYLSRVQGRIAGLIVAGSYEGGAILTWEQPAGTTSPSRLVPYLDKFAVLSSSQGSSGVADIVFQSMVRTCFPNGVCWRSRKDNPVNKWYFERADGHWQIPDTNWTIFWTGEGVELDEERWQDYVSVCTAVKPSWADDGKKPD